MIFINRKNREKRTSKQDESYDLNFIFISSNFKVTRNSGVEPLLNKHMDVCQTNAQSQLIIISIKIFINSNKNINRYFYF